MYFSELFNLNSTLVFTKSFLKRGIKGNSIEYILGESSIKIIERTLPFIISFSAFFLSSTYLMIAGKNKIPFVNENLKMQDALNVLRDKNLGFVIVRNSKKITTGILTDGDLKRKIKKNHKLHNLLVKK